MEKTKRRLTVFILLAVVILITVCSFQFRSEHTFTLTDELTADSNLKSEQIQPILGSVRVWGTQDTDVWFGDAENPEVGFQIGYITPGISETIDLEKGKWYTVHGAGEITIRMVNVRVP